MFKYENLDADAVVSSVMIRVAPGYDSEAVADAIRDKVDGVSVATATNMVSGIADSLNRISGTVSALIVAFWLLGMLMTVLLFTLMMNARKREFASLRAMGASRGILSGIVVREALTVNLLGGAIGILLTGVILFSFSGLIGESLGAGFVLTPTSGKVLLDDTDLYAQDEKSLARLRNEKIGLIPQGHTALLSLTVLENVLLPAILYNKENPPVDRAKALLVDVGLEALMTAKPNELSGGELRRMAIARAMLMRPGILLADEPTAGLDNENTLAVLGLLRKAADDGAGVLLVTHENEAAQFADEVYVMDGGKLSAQ